MHKLYKNIIVSAVFNLVLNLVVVIQKSSLMFCHEGRVSQLPAARCCLGLYRLFVGKLVQLFANLKSQVVVLQTAV